MGKKKMDIEKKKCITPKFRVSFPNVFKAKQFNDKQEAKYSLVMLFDKEEDLKKMKQAAFNAMVEEFGPQKDWPRGYKWPFRDGDKEKSDMEGYEGQIFVSASCKKQPGLVDQSRQPILSEDDFYAGCYARAEVIAYAFDVNGNKGVAFSLQNVQKMGDGEAFSGKRKAEDVFDEVEMDDNDESNFDIDEEFEID